MPGPVIAPRLVRTFVQHIHASPEEVFPLLCPEMEKAWLPGWDYRMIHSVSGIAEPGAVFETAHAMGTTKWMVTDHQPCRRIAFVRWQPDGLVVGIDISLGRHHEGTTAVCIEYISTPTDEPSRAILAKATEQEWLATMAHWEGSMNAWFERQRSVDLP
jgi:hypothetical protein